MVILRHMRTTPVLFLCVIATAAALLAANAVSAARPLQDRYPGAGAKQPAYPQQTSTPPPSCGIAWRHITTPNLGAKSNVLWGVAAVARDDVWAVGNASNSGPYVAGQPLIQHWNGSTWSLVPSPNPGPFSSLMDIAAISANDVWAVGNAGNQTLIERWNGSEWSIVPSPSIPSIGNSLTGVAALAPNDIWAVGYYGNTSGDSRTLVLHWNGSDWSIVPSPNTGTVANELYGVVAFAPNDVWAVGRIDSWGTRERTLTLHWDGFSWNTVSNPNPSGEFTPYALYGVDGRAPNDVWAVGAYRNSSFSRTLIERWNGSDWSIVPSPDANLNGDNEFHDVVAISANDVWAVGFYHDNFASGDHRGLIAHWDGAEWTIVPSPYPGSENNRLFGVDGSGPGDVWAVGLFGSSFNSVTSFALHHSDPCVTPAPTGTAATPTATPTVACVTGWSVVPSPNIGSNANVLSAIATASPNDIWAVGYHVDVNSVEKTLIMQWDGSGWSLVPSPNEGSLHNRLTGIVAIAIDDVWAVGYNLHTSGQYRPLTLHWNGTAWTIIPSPVPGTLSNYLHAVEAVSANDIWAVGNYSDSNGRRTLTMHWDGATWSVVPSHPGGVYGGSNLLAIDAITSDDIWAVGTDQNGPYPDTLTMHWNGSQWTTVPSPSPGSQYEDVLTGVAALSPGNVIATGYNFFNGRIQTLSIRWNGTSWSTVASPNVGSGRNVLYGADAGASGEVWAVGAYVSGSPAVTQTLVLRWNGSTWGIATSPNIGTTDNTLNGVAASPDQTWAVGFYANSDSVPRTLIERYLAVCNTPVPTATGVPNTPTFTRTPQSTPTDVPTYTPTRTATPTPTCPPQWQVVPNPTPGPIEGRIRGIDVASPDDIWAVGSYANTTTFRSETFIMRWNGSIWSVVPSPNVGTVPNYLYDVAVVSANDVWAVGHYGNYTGNDRTLTLHWDGMLWSIVDSPNPGTIGNFLYSVDAVSSNDVWAVGTDGGSGLRTLAMHWNGSAWSIISSPNRASFNRLHSVEAITTNDVWAAGETFDNTGGGYHTLTMHWNGSAWSIVPSPNPVQGTNTLLGISAVASNDIWAVGYYRSLNQGQSLVMHWDGSAWSIVPSPSPANQHLYMYAIDASAIDDVWAVGYTAGPNNNLIMHWDGTSWRTVPSPSPGSGFNELYGVAAVSAHDAWAVGMSAPSVGSGAPLALRYASACGTPTYTATSTVAATSTGTSTATAVSSTATPCAIVFVDVTADNAFYPFVRCLACRGIISGYSDGTFRPNNLVTRGQLAKIVSNAAGFQEDPNPQIFEDVPPSNTFYEWINRLTRRGFMSGYLCGGPGEPCVGNRPYFRPSANATRGQTSKIVANTAGYTEFPIDQTFEDVPPSHTFYMEIQRLASRNIMQGYPCGGPSEPCVSGKPYFRPQNNVTRGQSSKLVSNAFFPSCSP